MDISTVCAEYMAILYFKKLNKPRCRKANGSLSAF